jgi:hypothetical protein|nr:MAG TPA: hypothetical protein [Crassvirales sp.]
MQNETKKLTVSQLALFYGRKCIIIWQSEQSMSIRGLAKVGHTVAIEGILLASIAGGVYRVQPILRRWKTITEEECRELYKIETGNEWNVDIGDCRSEWWDEFNEIWASNDRLAIGLPSVWAKALDMGLDVFGWINKGLAIDESTL